MFCCHCLCFFPQDVNVTLVGWGETSGSKIEDPCVDPLTVISTCKAKWAVISYWSLSCLCYYNCLTGSVIAIFLLKMNKSASAYWRSDNLTVQSDKICVLSVHFFHLLWRQRSRLFLFLFNCETDWPEGGCEHSSDHRAESQNRLYPHHPCCVPQPLRRLCSNHCPDKWVSHITSCTL